LLELIVQKVEIIKFGSDSIKFCKPLKLHVFKATVHLKCASNSSEFGQSLLFKLNKAPSKYMTWTTYRVFMFISNCIKGSWTNFFASLVNLRATSDPPHGLPIYARISTLIRLIYNKKK